MFIAASNGNVGAFDNLAACRPGKRTPFIV